MAEAHPRIGVGVFVFKDGQFLIGQRQGAHGEGSWSLPGGHLEFGESWEEASTREVLEETGVTIENVRFGAATNSIFPKENKHYVTIWMLSEWTGGEPTTMEPDKCAGWRWVDFDNLPEPLFLPWSQLLKSEFIDFIKQASRESK